MKLYDTFKAIAIAKRLFELRESYDTKNIKRVLEERQAKLRDKDQNNDVNEAWIDGFNAGILAVSLDIRDIDLNELVNAVNIEPALFEALAALRNSYVIEQQDVS